ncbi:hypothetical protein GCM10010406_16500 [Streptomyces thermolineatus]|uniref:non-specific serine/threonine protein kinase n=1 Tax=Streptomyces thermolineatus TaxID=44033 RepID=A0ABP5YGK7_9ACTN
MLLAGRYRLDRLLGRGGMGEVWRAMDVILDRPVAVKLLLDPGHGSGAAERFRTEARTAARLNHPQVVSVYDFGCDGDRFYLVMELVTGRSLAEELAVGGPLSPRRAAAVGAQAAEGLAVAHERGVVHQDVKPENLLLTTDGTVKISDFGIARLTDGAAAARTGDEALVGTTPYLAPERVLGEQAGPASDVYALGCVLYTLLTGRIPFRADNPAGMLYQHVNTEPVHPRTLRPALPEPFGTYVLDLMAKDPARRPTARRAATWLGSPAWYGAAVPEPVPGTAAPLPALPRSPGRRRKRDALKELLLRGPGALTDAAAAAAGAAADALVHAPPAGAAADGRTPGGGRGGRAAPGGGGAGG